MRLIDLTRGQAAIVDAEDCEILSAFKWYAKFSPFTSSFYAVRKATIDGKRTTILMHREIFGAHHGEKIDHQNRNTLDNRRGNLRVASSRQSVLNQRLLTARNRSGYRGISLDQNAQRWRAQIKVKGKQIHLGFFNTAQEAARVYDAAARQYHEGFTSLNFPA
jgi:hypothetical protein